MFRIKLGAAEGALIRAAASTQTFGCFTMLAKTALTVVVGFVFVGSVVGQRHVIPVCPTLTEADQLVGWKIKLVVPKATTVDHGRDVDYSYWSIEFGHDKDRYELNGFNGLNVGNGEADRDYIARSRKLTRRYWTHNKLRGADSSGTFKNGKRWRNFGIFGEVIFYYNVPGDVAAYFDRLIATACIVD
ncbi:MAG: hypothetical protein ND895_01980 [Pyrinomonadaceae bacterium]|nr:hypothetical protein [Pyrinomonadaceae bacterium]